MRRVLNRIKARLRPKITRVLRSTGSGSARQSYVERMQAQPIVIKTAGSTPSIPWRQLMDSLDTAGSGLFKPGQRILIKVNLNTADPYPASTDPGFLTGFIKSLHTRGLTDILVGDCASLSAVPTRKVARKVGLPDAVDDLARLVYFDEMDWIEVPVAGRYLSKVTVPNIVYEVDRIVSLSNLKTHFLAGYTMALKSLVGFMHPVERREMHQSHLHQKLVEIGLAVMPDLNIIDGRTAFISGGPARGRTAEANVVILGTHPAAVDMEAYLELYRLKEQYNCLDQFVPNPLEMPQLKHAMEIWPESGWQNYQLIGLGGDS